MFAKENFREFLQLLLNISMAVVSIHAVRGVLPVLAMPSNGYPTGTASATATSAQQTTPVCPTPGEIIPLSHTYTNVGSVPVSLHDGVAIVEELFVIPGSCVSTVGTCVTPPDPHDVILQATLAPGQSAVVNYLVRVSELVEPGTQLCYISRINVGGPIDIRESCFTVCPKIEEVDQRGSILFYNVYTSSAANPNVQNTSIAVTNADASQSVALHLFFIDGSTCSVADRFMCLTPSQTSVLLASDQDPGITGYLVVIAVDPNTGCPIAFNNLIGEEYVKFETGHTANLLAESFKRRSTSTCDEFSVASTLAFDGFQYDRAPRVLAISSIPSRADGNDTMLVLNRVGGDLSTRGGVLFTVFGLLFNSREESFSFNFVGSCQFRSSLSNSFPRTTPRFERIIQANESGWLKLWTVADFGILGSVINFNPGAATSPNAFNQGRNLHKLKLTSAAIYTMPIFPPTC